MPIPLEITFEGGLTSSEALRRRIGKEAEKLERFHARIVMCRIAVKGRSHRRKHGDLFDVRLQISTPGGRDIVIDRNPPADHAHEDAFVAIRDAFNAARRRLQDRHRRQQGKTKVHEAPAEGRIVRLNKDGFGFIESVDGREVYFHRNALRNKPFGQLRKGSKVRFLEAEMDGLVQASTVHFVESR
jgi:cold shock CspA family protein/ribosome-associated translation inhibitor RaiA